MGLKKTGRKKGIEIRKGQREYGVVIKSEQREGVSQRKSF